MNKYYEKYYKNNSREELLLIIQDLEELNFGKPKNFKDFFRFGVDGGFWELFSFSIKWWIIISIFSWWIVFMFNYFVVNTEANQAVFDFCDKYYQLKT